MGLLDTFKAMLGLGGGAGGSVDRGLYVYVQCNRCKDVVRVRINMASEVSEVSDEPEDDGEVATAATGGALIAPDRRSDPTMLLQQR